MEWGLHLEAGERLLWEGCPAPRCFCFRGWRRAGWALPLLALAFLLRAAGVAASGNFWAMALCLGGAFWFFPGRFFWARLQWGTVFYAISDRFLLTVSGRFRRRLIRLERSRIESIEAEWHGPDLATLAVFGRGGTRVTLHCLEHPRPVLALLEGSRDRSGKTALSG